MTWPSVTLPVAAFELDYVPMGATALIVAVGAFACTMYLRTFDRSIKETATQPSEAIGRFWGKALITAVLLLLVLAFVWTDYCKTHVFAKWFGLEAV